MVTEGNDSSSVYILTVTVEVEAVVDIFLKKLNYSLVKLTMVRKPHSHSIR